MLIGAVNRDIDTFLGSNFTTTKRSEARRGEKRKRYIEKLVDEWTKEHETVSRRKAGGQVSILLGSQLVFNSLIRTRRVSTGQVISPGARALLALKDLSVISTSAGFRLRKILNNDLIYVPSRSRPERSFDRIERANTGVPSPKTRATLNL